MTTRTQTQGNGNGAGSQARIAPHSVEAEEAVLGSVLINPEAYLDLSWFLQASDFFLVRHRWIWEAIGQIHARREAIDYVTVTKELRNAGQLDEAGGPAYLTYLVNNTPTSIHAASYALEVRRTATRRQMLAAADDIVEAAYAEGEELDQSLDKADAAWGEVTMRTLKRDVQPVEHYVSSLYDEVEHRYTHQGETHGVPTGFTALDRMTGGMQKSDLLIVAGRPGMGKSSLLLNIAHNAARHGQRVGFFSLEMSGEQIVQRLIAADIGINSQKLRLGNLTPEEWEKFLLSAERISELPLFIDDTPALSVPQLRTKVRRLYLQHGLELVVVDYLQLLHPGERVDNRAQAVGLAAMALKQIAREMNRPVLVAAQLNRGVEHRQDKRPMLADLRESGAIEQEADVVQFIYRPDAYDEDTDKPNIAEIIVAKHRNGPTGTVDLFFKKELTQFTDVFTRTVDLDTI